MFLKSGLASKSKDCELKCTITPTNMDSFSCTDKCGELCSKSISEQILKYTPRLTEGDKIALSKMPYEAYKAFIAKEQTQKLTKNIFQNPKRGDESDAFRHFVWSCLLAESIGVKKAKTFLLAHEEDSTQSSSEKKNGFIQ